MCGHCQGSGGREHAFATSPVRWRGLVSDGVLSTYRTVPVLEQVLVAPSHDVSATATGDWDREAGTGFMRRTDCQSGKSCLQNEYLFA